LQKGGRKRRAGRGSNQEFKKGPPDVPYLKKEEKKKVITTSGVAGKRKRKDSVIFFFYKKGGEKGRHILFRERVSVFIWTGS